MASDPAPGSGRRGRPRGGHDASLDWEAAENRYIYGELIDEGGHQRRVFPSLSSIARAIGTTKQNASRYARRHRWAERRADAQRGRPHTNETASDGGSPRERRSIEAIVEDVIALFDDSLREGRMRASVADLDRAVRLRAFVRGESDSRQEKQVIFSLDELTRRHLAQRVRVQAIAQTPAVSGVLVPGRDPDSE